MLKFTVSSEVEIGTRLDSVLVLRLPDLSRASIQKLSREGKIMVNGEKQKISYKPRHGDKVAVDYDAEVAGIIPNITISVLYEDDNCVVINKPIGLLTHSKGDFNPEATVATWLEAHAGKQISQTENARNGIVHRLDRATSGVMICAKNPEALSFLQKQFSLRKAKKQYMAIVSGQLEQPKAVIDMPIERNPKQPQTFRVNANGKHAITAYETIKATDTYTLLLLAPTTGRTHQLRVHLSYLKHPIVGDTLYEGEPAERLFLHAKSLEITIPGGERKTFEAAVPPEFAQFLKDHA